MSVEKKQLNILKFKIEKEELQFPLSGLIPTELLH